VLAGLDTNVLIDVRLLRIEPVLARVLEGEGWTTVFVEREFGDPLEETEGGVARVFPFLEIDPVDARLLPRIERDQIAIMGRQKAAAGAAAGEASLVHVALPSRSGSIVLSNDPHAVGLGRRRGVTVRGTLYVMHRAFSAGLLDAAEAWTHYRTLRDRERRLPRLSRQQLDRYLQTGMDPRK
jgi:predicted nucleic acid-binding protein